ncbi:hypothetical protein BCR61_21740 [Xanthomonas oryzae pv. oryzae]|uniref:Uncharacterized protein n=1 Tax=Xanthomonas oryzae pv. oryzicola (strain BLS256) TaxID=383407 RepID=G7TBI8_XANOB|nr:hypothetical protein XOC_0660 [Xanthomonas oryzae pv. oryzicola BLS256]AXQ10796.1 hypothetical protein BCR61_21740 [Xanthomonas oryzae pv. oryzae]OWB21626.1 hypothetical protein XocBAI15_15925 [Xanthomonas oryzae pv. oryzicola]AXQ76727.1 hypothetical protein BXU03_21425 [Xanthomonas oryzae pv. oryzae]OWB27710.1 hypothetical protein XocBAI20_13400 [Xanthomonas oryzae pv. oryzicola]
MGHGKRPKWRAGPSEVSARRQASHGDDWIQQTDPACCRNACRFRRIGADPGSLNLACPRAVAAARCAP